VIAANPQRTAAPVVSYRCFRWRFGKLVSATTGDVWTAQLQQASCRWARHPAPQFDCTCGIHAFGSLATAERLARGRWWKWPGLFTGTVIGAVLLWSEQGRPLVAGELALRSGVRGWRPTLQYRAPCARLVALLDDGPAARRAAATLGVPALPRRDEAGRPVFERFAREHGEELEAPAAASVRPAVSPLAATGAHPIVRRIASQRGAWHGALVLGLALVLAVVAAVRLSWLVLKPALRVTWWLAWWSARLGWAVFVFVLLLALSIVLPMGQPGGQR
jgi:hypothetical protein